MDKIFTGDDYTRYMKSNQVWLDKINREMTYKPRAEWVKRLTFEQWLQFQNGELRLYDPLDRNDVIASRDTRYYFKKGTEVMVDVSVMSPVQLEKYKDVIGVKGIVRECSSDSHGFAQGSSYQHEVDFVNGIKTIPFSEWKTFDEFSTPTYLLIPFKV